MVSRFQTLGFQFQVAALLGAAAADPVRGGAVRPQPVPGHHLPAHGEERRTATKSE